MQLHRRRDRCGPAARQLRYMDTVECPAGKSSANVNQGCGSPHAAVEEAEVRTMPGSKGNVEEVAPPE